jgi:archaemetzincin
MKKIDKDILDKTYGIHKFKIPSKEEQISAMGLAGESITTKKIISHQFEKFYDSIPSPDIGDWLMSHKEYGQTFSEFIQTGIIPIERKRDTVYLAPLSCGGEHGSLDPSFVNSILLVCEAYFYGMKVRLLDKPIDLNNYEINIRVWDDSKLQIYANEILGCLYGEFPEDAYCLLAFTDKDLYNDNNVIKPRNFIKKSNDKEQNNIKSSYNFCFGLSALKYRVGVVSFARYDPLFYSSSKINYESPKHQEKIMKYFFILLKRACKVVFKEICHMFGLKNCIYFQCNMNGFNSMEEFDKKPFEICPVCLRKLYTAVTLKNCKLENARMGNSFLIYDRFVKLKDTLEENFSGIYKNEQVWYHARIKSLKSEFN